MIRIFAETKGFEQYPIILDVLLDKDGYIRKNRFFGIQGRFDGTFYPFVIDMEGYLEFGSDYGDEDRIETNIRKKIIRNLEQFTTIEFDEEMGRKREFVYVMKIYDLEKF